MAWSTRELAELAGTTMNTIRHYHRIGLLEAPRRRHNGYKQYGARDLICLLRIRRLVELGVPLAKIGTVGAETDAAPEILRQVDDDLAIEIDRLLRARSDIAVILREGASADAPAGFESVAARLSSSDRSLVHVYTRLYDQKAMKDLRRMVEADTDPINAEIDALAPDADEATRQSLAERLAPVLTQLFLDHPWLTDQAKHLSQSARVTQQTVMSAAAELYNPAQLDVRVRSRALALAQFRLMRRPADD